jgi:hypothetical protein
MPQIAAQTKKVIVTLAGDPEMTSYEVEVELGATPASVFEAMGLAQVNGLFAYQLTKPAGGVFQDNENVYGNVKPGDKLKAVPKANVAA